MVEVVAEEEEEEEVDGGQRLARHTTSWPLSMHLMRLKQESFPPDRRPTNFIEGKYFIYKTFVFLITIKLWSTIVLINYSFPFQSRQATKN